MFEQSTVAPRDCVLLAGPPLTALGGGPTHMKNLLTSLLQDRYRLIHFETGSRGRESPAVDESLPAAVWRLLVSPFQLAWQILKWRPVVVHLNGALDKKAVWRDAAYLAVCKLLGRKVALQFHGGAPAALKPRSWVRRVFALADALVVLGESVKVELTELRVSTPIVVIPNGIDIAPFQQLAARRDRTAVRRVAYLGRLTREKGLFEAMEAIRVLREDPRFTSLEFHLAGAGEARAELERFAAAAGLREAVHFCGPLHGEAKIAFLRTADVFLFPSYREGLPYAVLESLAAGTPLVATRVGNVPDVVINGQQGILISPRDPGAIVLALTHLHESPGLLDRMSRECLQASAGLGLDRAALRFGQLYEQLRA